MILRPWLGQNKPPLGARPIPGHPLRPDCAFLLDERSGDRITDAIAGSMATLVLMDPATDWVSGERGTCLDFDGVDDYVTAGIIPGFGSISGFTVSMLLNCRSSTSDQRAVSRGANADDAGTVLLWGDDICGSGIQGAGNTDTFMFLAGNSSDPSNKVNGTNSARIVGKWQTVTGVMRGASRSLYVDGVLDTSHESATRVVLETTASPLWFGDWIAASSKANMQLAYVLIYFRALSLNEVRSVATMPYQWLGVPDLAAMYYSIPTTGVYPVFGGDHVIQGAWQL